MVIEWSDKDQVFVVFLPEWEGRLYQPVTDGATHEDAARKGQDVLDTLIRIAQEDSQPLPEPRIVAIER